MEQPLLTIGAFARAVGLSPSALRYYDECGLLRPAEVDETTGYRYYTPDLAARARAVIRLREAGVSIEGMRGALDGDVDERRRVLREALAEQEAAAARRHAALAELLANEAPAPVEQTVSVAGPELAAAIRQVQVAADRDAGSPLAGVLLDATAGTIDVVATNRYWLALRTLAVSTASDLRVVISPANLNELCAALDRHDRARLRSVDGALDVEGSRFAVRDVAYPAHRMLLEGLTPSTTRTVLPRQELLDAIAAVGHAELDFQVRADGVCVEDRVVAGTVDSPGASLRLGTALARRAVECALGRDVVVRLGAETQPVWVTSPYQQGFLALLMPIARTER